MGSEIVVSAHVPIELTKPHKVGLKYAILEAEVCFHNPEKNDNTRYRSAPQLLLPYLYLFSENQN